jgi:hypothetical protein
MIDNSAVPSYADGSVGVHIGANRYTHSYPRPDTADAGGLGDHPGVFGVVFASPRNTPLIRFTTRPGTWTNRLAAGDQHREQQCGGRAMMHLKCHSAEGPQFGTCGSSCSRRRTSTE